MTTTDWLLVLLLALCLIIPVATADPITSAAYDVGNNNATIIVLNSWGDTWITWGRLPGHEMWLTPNETAYGAINITIWGAPLMGNTQYFCKACNQTGCGAEVNFTTKSVDYITDYNYRRGFVNMTSSHFNPVMAIGTILMGYTRIMPATVVFGLFFGMLVIGMWLRTKSVRLVSIVMLIASPFIMSSQAGLYLGIPLAEQALGQALLAAAIAGIGLSFIKR